MMSISAQRFARERTFTACGARQVEATRATHDHSGVQENLYIAEVREDASNTPQDLAAENLGAIQTKKALQGPDPGALVERAEARLDCPSCPPALLKYGTRGPSALSTSSTRRRCPRLPSPGRRRPWPQQHPGCLHIAKVCEHTFNSPVTLAAANRFAMHSEATVDALPSLSPGCPHRTCRSPP